jgi:peroxiredoxin
MSSNLVDPRKLGAVVLLLGASGLVVALFLWMVGPAAAREVQAACNGMRPSWNNPAFGKIPAKAPDFALQDGQGQTVKLSDYRGKVVLVNFWASWCGVCKTEKKSLARFARKLEGEDFVVLSLASDTDPAAVALSMADGLGSTAAPPFKILYDPPAGDANIGAVGSAWGVQKVPDSFLVDRDGDIRMYIVNKRDWNADVVATCVRSLIDE